MTLSPAEIIDLLCLQPHPTCGFFRETYRSDLRVPANTFGRGYEGDRALGGVLYFLVTPQAPVRLHRIRSDQMYHHYLGDPLEVLLLYPDGKSEVRIVGSDLAAGMRPQVLVPGATFHAARLPSGGKFSLLGTSVWLRAEPSDVEMADPERLAAAYPPMRETIKAFTS